MELFNGVLGITHSELAEVTTLGYDALKKQQYRGAVVQLRRACYDTPALFAVDSLPWKYRKEVYRRHPDLKEKAESQVFVDKIEPDGMAMHFYSEYVLKDGRYLTPEKQSEYSNNCAILNAFEKVIEESNSHRIRQSKPKLKIGEFWERAAAALPRLGDRFPNSLPSSGRRLQSRYRKYKKEGYICFISKKYHNNNAAKILDKDQESIIIGLLAHHNNLDNVTISELYNQVAEYQDWEQISSSTVGIWRKKYDLITARGRRGFVNYRNEKTMQVKRVAPSAAFLMWTLDGWDAELLYQDIKENKNGHNIRTYTNRLTLEVVLDPCCKYPIGYAISTHETPELILEALRNAAKHTEDLFGEMLKPYQLQCDRYAFKHMKDKYAAVSGYLIPAQAKNAKSKVIEPYFNYINNKYCKKFNNWSGYGVTTNPKRQPNSEALNKFKKQFPTKEECIRQLETIIAFERASKREEFMKCYAKLDEKHKLPLSREDYLLNYGLDSNPNTLVGSGLHPTLLGVKRSYDCFDINFRKHSGERWVVKYDPDNLDNVLAINDDGSLRYMLERKYVQPMAIAERTEQDNIELARVRAFNEQLEHNVTKQLAEAHETIEEMIGETSNRKGILGRLLLTDSEGQHKLPKAQARLTQSEVDDIDAEIISSGRSVRDEKDDYENDYSIF